MILMNIDIVVMVMDLIWVHSFHDQMVAGVKKLIFLMSLSVHVDNRKKDILVLGEGPTQGLYDGNSNR